TGGRELLALVQVKGRRPHVRVGRQVVAADGYPLRRRVGRRRQIAEGQEGLTREGRIDRGRATPAPQLALDRGTQKTPAWGAQGSRFLEAPLEVVGRGVRHQGALVRAEIQSLAAHLNPLPRCGRPARPPRRAPARAAGPYRRAWLAGARPRRRRPG